MKIRLFQNSREYAAGKAEMLHDLAQGARRESGILSRGRPNHHGLAPRTTDPANRPEPQATCPGRPFGTKWKRLAFVVAALTEALN